MFDSRSGGRWTSVVTAILGSAALLMVQGIILGILGTVGLSAIFRMEFAFTADRFREAFESLGPVGKDAVVAHLPWCFALMFLYAAAGYAILHLLFTPKPKGFQRLNVQFRVRLMHSYRSLRERQWLRVLPVIAAFFHLGENVLQMVMVQEVSLVNTFMAPVSGVLGCLKYGFLLASVVVGLWAVARRFAAGSR